MTCNALVVVVVVVVAWVVIVEVVARMLRVVRYQHLYSTAENPVEFGQDIRILLVEGKGGGSVRGDWSRGVNAPRAEILDLGGGNSFEI